ncbi:prephenate dehydrogenase/arogenate dehydrogenase family protein [Gardnerella vaginalis]|uniref:prephenate dehydrogenase n=1 Tax=Gardnerella vaginalis TaxID=2702 RepID=UPI0007E41D78|nr:prephenate dehydrogenase/arogenate dehydrogenase family protein [Gardnerella vaginalis]PKZ58812.1 prephenate dehydrogenase/arogenate dehydrogenase family protein [Gardnerella vaginalis]
MVEDAGFSKKFSVGIVGLGLIGGSIAKRLAATGSCKVYAYNRHQTMYKEARVLGITCVESVAELARMQPNVLILCNSLAAMPEVLGEISRGINKQRTTLTDVGSVKGLVREQVKAAGLGDCYIGAHPMAGSEFTGWQASSAQLLDGALWAVSVDESSDFWRFCAVLRVIVALCGNRALVLNDSIHDASAALISHMPHVVSTALANVLCGSENRNVALQMSAGSWRDMTRVALTDPNRTRAMVEENRRNVADLLGSVIEELSFAKKMLERIDGDSAVACDERDECDERAFFAKADSWREYKYKERAVACDKSAGDLRELRFALDCAGDWQSQLIQSAQSGEQIVGVAFSDSAVACALRNSKW